MRNIFKKQSNFFNKFETRDLLLIVPSVVLYLIISFRNISGSSIWFDEGFGVYLSRFDFVEIAKYTALDVHPPLYYWLLKIWTFFFGVTEFSVRSMSIIFASIALVLIFFIVKDFFTRKAAAIAIFLTSISPMLIRYGEEARMYTLVLCIALVGTWLFLKALKNSNKRYWTYYGIVVGIGLWAHYFIALVWIVHWLFMITNNFSNYKDFRALRKKIFSYENSRPYFIALAIFLPWLPFMLFQLGVVQGGGFWIGQVGLYSFTNYLTNTFYYSDQALVLSWLAAMLLCLICVSYYLFKKSHFYFNDDKKVVLKLFISIALLSPVILFVLSLPPLRSAFVERYLLTASIFIPISLAVLISEARLSNIKNYLIVSLITIMSIVGIGNVYFYGNYNKNSHTEIMTREMYQEATKRANKGEPVIASSPWIYYEGFIYSTKDNPLYFADQDTAYEYGSLNMLRDTQVDKINNIENFLKDNKRFWYIGTSDKQLEAPYPNICKLDSFVLEDKIDRKMQYQGVEYKYCNY